MNRKTSERTKHSQREIGNDLKRDKNVVKKCRETLTLYVMLNKLFFTTSFVLRMQKARASRLIVSI